MIILIYIYIYFYLYVVDFACFGLFSPPIVHPSPGSAAAQVVPELLPKSGAFAVFREVRNRRQMGHEEIGCVDGL